MCFAGYPSFTLSLMIFESFSILQLLSIWVVLVFWSVFLGLYRTIVDRIRSGLIASPKTNKRTIKLFEECLRLPNHERPLHVEASCLSSLQVFCGFIVLTAFITKYLLLEANLWIHIASFLSAIAVERISSWIFPKNLAKQHRLNFSYDLDYFLY